MSDFVPGNRLEGLLVRAASDPAARPDFYRELFNSTLYVLTPSGPEVGKTAVLAHDGPIHLVQWEGPGGLVTPIFSSAARVEELTRRNGKPLGCVGLEGAILFRILAQQAQTAVLNPGFAFGKELTPEEIRSLAEGTIFATGEQRVVQRQARVLLGQPAVYPMRLVDALKRLFEQHESVEAAYLAQVQIEGGTEGPHPIVGLVSRSYRNDVENAGMVAQQIGEPSLVDFVEVLGHESEVVPRYLLEKTKPFFERPARKRWWKSS